MDDALRLAAPAKLNLYLHVTGRRDDGYHLLDGLAAFASVHDTLAVAPAERLEFTADGPFAAGLGDGDSNLVVRAARALAKAVGRAPHVRIALTKRLPVASGIGGGSADAAACLTGLAELWGIDPRGQQVMEVAARLGSDIPVCVGGRAAFMGGIGTEIAPAPALPPVWLVLANPGVALATPSVYRARQGAFRPAARFDTAFSSAAELASCLAERSNDLTEAAIGLVPEIGTVLEALGTSEDCLLARMSGSGATCFGLYGDEAAAGRAAETIRGAHPRWWVEPGRLLESTGGLAA